MTDKSVDIIGEMIDFEHSLRPLGEHHRCDHCQFWQYHLPLREPDNFGDEPRGECHRHAPSPFQHVLSLIGKAVGATAYACEETAHIEHDEEGKAFGTDYTFESVDQQEVDEWPRTYGREWCGDFVAMTPAKWALRETRGLEFRARYAEEERERERRLAAKTEAA